MSRALLLKYFSAVSLLCFYIKRQWKLVVSSFSLQIKIGICYQHPSPKCHHKFFFTRINTYITITCVTFGNVKLMHASFPVNINYGHVSVHVSSRSCLVMFLPGVALLSLWLEGSTDFPPLYWLCKPPNYINTPVILNICLLLSDKTVKKNARVSFSLQVNSSALAWTVYSFIWYWLWHGRAFLCSIGSVYFEQVLPTKCFIWSSSRNSSFC